MSPTVRQDSRRRGRLSPLLYPNERGDCRPEQDFPAFIRSYREGKLRLNDLVTHRYSLDQINAAVDDLEHGRILGRGILYLCLIAAN